MRTEKVKKWLEIFNKVNNVNFKINDIDKQDTCTYEQFKKIKCKFYEQLRFINITTLDLNNYIGVFGLNLNKLDVKLYNELIKIYGYKVHNMSLKEKCKLYFNDKEYKIICKSFIY